MERIFDAILVRPPEDVIDTWYNHFESLGIAYIASFARRRFLKIHIIDSILQKKNNEQIAKEIVEINPIIVGFSVFQIGYSNTLKIINHLRELGYSGHLTLGGHFPTFAYNEILSSQPQIDSIILHEGEIPFCNLIDTLKSGKDWTTIRSIAYRNSTSIKCNPIEPFIPDLDSIPNPSRDLLQLALKTNDSITVSASRGCFYSCSYCTIPSFYNGKLGKKWRGRSPIEIVNEIEFLIVKYKCKNITFTDENFFGIGQSGKKRVFEIASEIIKRDIKIEFSFDCRVDSIEKEIFKHLKKAGLRSVYLGIENSVDSVLKRWNKTTTNAQNISAIKLLKSLKINIIPGFILWDSDSTIEELQENIIFLKKYKSFDYPSLLRKIELRYGNQMTEKYMKEVPIRENPIEFNFTFKHKEIEDIYNLYSSSMRDFSGIYYKMLELKRKNIIDIVLYQKLSDRFNLSALCYLELIIDNIMKNNSQDEYSKFLIKLNKKILDDAIYYNNILNLFFNN